MKGDTLTRQQPDVMPDFDDEISCGVCGRRAVFIVRSHGCTSAPGCAPCTKDEMAYLDRYARTFGWIKCSLCGRSFGDAEDYAWAEPI